MALAGATLAKLGECGGAGDGGNGSGGGGEAGKARERAARLAAAVLPLAEDLLRAAGAEARGRLRTELSRGQKRQRDSAPPLVAGGAVSDGVTPARGGGGKVTPARGSNGDTAASDGGENSHKKRALGGRQQQLPQQEQQRQRQSQQLSPAASTPVPRGGEHDPSRRDRGCTVWETPRGVGLTPKIPGARTAVPPFSATRNGDDGGGRAGGLDRPDCPGSASSVQQQPRARGQTVWETPRGVGLTPKTPGARGGMMPLSAARNGEDAGGRAGGRGGLEYPGSASGAYQQPRARGQTVLETPRGVGLTPKTPSAASQSLQFSAERGGRTGSYAGGGDGGVEESKGEEAPPAGDAPGTYQQPRARGQTVWETPRGVGLTPKTPGAVRTARSPLSAREGASPAGWSAASGSSSASPLGGHGQQEVRSYAQGGS